MALTWISRSKRFETKALPHLGALYRMARHLVGAQGAEDLVQETLLRAWKYFDSVDSANNCRAWLFRILRNAWISHWRKSHLDLPLWDVGSHAFEPSYEWEVEFLRDEFSSGMKRALQNLPDDFRMVILLADVEEFTYQEIARIMGCPVGTVMSRLSRARRILVQEIQSQRESVACEEPVHLDGLGARRKR